MSFFLSFFLSFLFFLFCSFFFFAFYISCFPSFFSFLSSVFYLILIASGTSLRFSRLTGVLATCPGFRHPLAASSGLSCFPSPYITGSPIQVDHSRTLARMMEESARELKNEDEPHGCGAADPPPSLFDDLGHIIGNPGDNSDVSGELECRTNCTGWLYMGKRLNNSMSVPGIGRWLDTFGDGLMVQVARQTGFMT
jgi:hypothetical protein